ncbi:MAG: dihydroorotate dehydrogenase-like protein [Thermoflexales bacterium]|nr:dihydroorotate dehydrogenase-like protein [Thermoflexales bacterium]
MADLSTTYLGLQLKSPLVPAASPLSKKLDGIKHMEDAGAAAITMYSLFEEQITLESEALNHYLTRDTDSFAEALSYFPDLGHYNIGPEGYLELIRKAKQAVGVPIIGSLNGVSSGGWVDYAKKIEQAGADALELNVYYIPTDLALSGADVEKMYLELVQSVKASVKIPVAVKLGHFFTAFANVARQLDGAGADGLVLFNRFYQPDLNLEALEVVPNLTLSSSSELRVRLRWVAILYGRIKANMAVTGGVHTAEDVLKCMMVGAKVATLGAVLLREGVDHIRTLETDLVRWMEEHEYDSIAQMQGSMSQQKVAEPAAFERANYLKILQLYKLPAP